MRKATTLFASISAILAAVSPHSADAHGNREERGTHDRVGQRQFRNIERPTRNQRSVPIIRSGRDAPTERRQINALIATPPVASTLPLRNEIRNWSRHQPRLNVKTIGSELPGGAYQLDLSSSNASIVLGSRLFRDVPSVTIQAGGGTRTFSAGQKVTAAEFVAIKQLLANGTQSITVSSDGIAAGGNFAFSDLASGKVNDLVIPENVEAYNFFSASPRVRLAGDLVNYGTIYGVATGRNSNGRITADDISNFKGATISTSLPDDLEALIPGNSDKANLTIDALGRLTNSGIISSSGNLSLSSGSTLTNGSDGTAGSSTIEARGDVNLSLGNGELVNHGTVRSAKGNINISTLDDAAINIQANNGSFSATSGDINIRDESYAGSNGVWLSGGDYLSKSLNIHSGTGAIEGRVRELTGRVNSQAGVAHLFADTDNLILGDNCITGDPTFANNGSITIDGTNTFSEAVAIIANGDINSSGKAQIIANGFDVTLIAGVDPGAAAPTTDPITGSPTNGISGSVTIDFDSPNNKGGNINLSNLTPGQPPGTLIDTRSGTGSGDVKLAAYANGSTGGSISLIGKIDTSSGVTAGPGGGPPAGDGGNVTIIAGADPLSPTNTIQLAGAITTGGASSNPLLPSGNGGDIFIVTAQPTGTGGSTVTFDNTGKITNGGPIISSGTVSKNADVLVTTLNTSLASTLGTTPSDAGNVTIHAGHDVALQIQAQGSNGANGTSTIGKQDGRDGGNGGDVQVTSDTGSITGTGILTTGGTGGNGATLSPGTTPSGKGGEGGSGGKIILNAVQGLITLTSFTSLNSNGGNGGNGANGNGFTSSSNTFNSVPGTGGTGGDGGLITVSADEMVAGNIFARGGNGGTGGNGNPGMPSSPPGYDGGPGAHGGDGGSAGPITLDIGSGGLQLSNDIQGAGGSGGKGGKGGAAGPPGPTAGGVGGAGGHGGDGSTIIVNSDGQLSAAFINSFGGAGGAGGLGGSIAPIGQGGDGGDGKDITLSAPSIIATPSTKGGAGGTGTISGTIGLSGDLSIETSTLTADGLSGNKVSIASFAGQGIDIHVLGVITALNSLTVTSDAKGSFQQPSGTTITTPLLDVQLASGDVLLGGDITNAASPVNISVVTTGSVSLKTVSPTLLSSIKGDDVTVSVLANDATINGDIVSDTSLEITTGGILSVSAGVEVNSKEIVFTAADVLLGNGALLDAGGSGAVSLNPIGNQTIGVGDPTGSTFGQFNISAQELTQISAGSLAVLGGAASGDMRVMSNLTSFANGVSLSAGGSVTIDAGLLISASQVNVTGSDFILSSGASINTTPSGTVSLTPVSNQTIGLSDPTGSTFGQFNVSVDELNRTIAGNLIVGLDTKGDELRVLSDLTGYGNSITLASLGSIATANGAEVDSTSVSLGSGSGSIGSQSAPFATIADSLFVSAATDAFITNVGPVTLLGAKGFAPNSTISVSTTPNASGNGAITVADGATVTSASVVLVSSETASGTGGINQQAPLSTTTIFANKLQLADLRFTAGIPSGVGNGSISLATSAGTSSLDLSATTTGNLNILDSSQNGLALSGNETYNSLTLASRSIAVSDDIASQTTLNLTTLDLTIDTSSSLSGDSVTVQGMSDGTLTLNNKGNLTATAGGIDVISASGQQLVITGGGSIVATTGSVMNFTATDNPDGNHPAIEFLGDQSFAFSSPVPGGTVNFNASGNGQAVIVNAGCTADFPTNNTKVVINSPSLILNGAINLHNPPNTGTTLTFNSGPAAGTIANSSGSPLNLAALPNLTFHGQNLTIMSSGNITDSGSTLSIDLSNASGGGGQLFLLAGFKFTPSTVGTQGPNATVYTNLSPSTGAIQLSKTSIITSGTTFGGDVQAVANGTISLGSIKTTGGTSSSGDIMLLGKGITLASKIDTANTNPLLAGDVDVLSATVQMSGTFIVASGVVTGGTFSPGVLQGNISLAGVNAGSASTNISTGSTGFISSSSAINTGVLTLKSGSGGIASQASQLLTNAASLTAGSQGGDVWITDSNPNLEVQGTSSARNLSLTASGGTITLGANAAIQGTQSVSLKATGGLIEMVDGTGFINTPILNLITNGGSIGNTNAIRTNASTLTAFASNGSGIFGNVSIVDTNTSTLTLARNLTLGLDSSGDRFSVISDGTILIGANATIIGSTSVVLATTGSGAIGMQNSSGKIATPALILTTQGGTIGSGTAINTSANSIVASATNGSTYGNVSILATAAGTIHLSHDQTLLLDNTGANFSLTATNGSLVIDADAIVKGNNSALLSVQGNNTINGPGSIETAVLTLKTAGGAIGSAGSIFTNASNLTAYAYNGTSGFGDVSITGTSDLALVRNLSLGLDNTGNKFEVSSFGSITIGSGSTVRGNTSVKLNAFTEVKMVDGTGFINTPTLDVFGLTGIGVGAFSGLKTNAATLTAFASPSFDAVILDSASLVTLTGLNSAGRFALTMTNATQGSIILAANQSIEGLTNVELTSAGALSSIQIGSNASIKGNGIKLSTPTLTNSGTIQALGSGAIAIDNSNGNLSVSNTGGTILVPGSLSFSAKGSASLTNFLTNTQFDPGANLLIVAGSNVTNNGAGDFSIDLSSNTASGNLTILAGANYLINQDGSQIEITGASTTGGSINLATGQKLNTINTTSSSGGGGSILMAATKGSGAGSGTITLPSTSQILTGGQSNSGDVVLIGEAATGTSITAAGLVDTVGSSSGSGKILLSSAKPLLSGASFAFAVNTGTAITPGALASGAVVASNLNTNLSDVSIRTTGNITLTSLQATNIELLASNGTITLPALSGLTANPLGESGGLIKFTANTLTYANSATTPFTFSAMGTGSGDGGTIEVSFNSATTRTIGSSANNFRLLANGGASGSLGGDVTFKTGGNLTVNPADVQVQPLSLNGFTGTIELESGTASNGSLLINGSLDFSGSPNLTGGAIFLTSNSTQVFNIGSMSGSSGVKGSLGVPVFGTIEIVNKKGGITNTIAPVADFLFETAAGPIFVNTDMGSPAPYGLVSLTTTGTGSFSGAGKITTGGQLVLNAVSNIGSSNTPLTVSAQSLSATAGGLVNILNDFNGPVTLGESKAGTTFKLATQGSLQTVGDIVANTNVTLASTQGISLGSNITATSGTGKIVLDATGSFIAGTGGVAKAQSIQLDADSVGSLGINTASLLVNAVTDVSLINVGTAALTVQGSDNNGTFSLDSLGDINLIKAIAKAQTIILSTAQSANKSIAIKSQLGSTTATDQVILITGGTGNISNTGTNTISTKASGSVQLASSGGNIGLAGTTLRLNSGTISASTSGTGIVNITNLANAPMTLLSSASGGAFTLNSQGPTTVDGVTSLGGNIVISNISGLLLTSPNSIISTGNGTITLQSKSLTQGAIEIGFGSQISTFSPVKTSGQIYIVIGAVQIPAQGVAPGNVQVNLVTTGKAYFGNGITALGPTNVVNLIGSDVVFNTRTLPASAIQLDGNVVITADPIVVPGAANSSFPSIAPSLSSGDGIIPMTQVISSQQKDQTNNQTQLVGTNFNFQNTDSRDKAVALQQALLATLPAVNGSTLNVLPVPLDSETTERAWISETELESGEIPALLAGDEALQYGPEESISVDLDQKPVAESVDETQPINLISLMGSKMATTQRTRHSTLRKGSVLFVPTEDSTVTTDYGDVRIDKGSIVLILSFGKSVSIFSIDDSHKGAVVFQGQGRTIHLAPGTHITLTDGNSRSFEEINPGQTVGHAAVQEYELNQKTKLIHSRFALPDIISSVTPLRRIVCHQHPHARKLSDHLIKTTSVLMHLQGNSQYTRIPRPSKTAWRY